MRHHLKMKRYVISMHRYEAVCLLLLYTVCAMSFGRMMPNDPVLSAVEFTSAAVIIVYLAAKLVFNCSRQPHHARTKDTAKVVT